MSWLCVTGGVIQLTFIALPSADHGNKSLFNLAISKELSERLIGVQNAPATKYVTMVMCIRLCIII